jgi:hypothetical protein
MVDCFVYRFLTVNAEAPHDCLQGFFGNNDLLFTFIEVFEYLVLTPAWVVLTKLRNKRH